MAPEMTTCCPTTPEAGLLAHVFSHILLAQRWRAVVVPEASQHPDETGQHWSRYEGEQRRHQPPGEITVPVR